MIPHHKAHSTEVVGLHDVQGGDNWFLNNIFAGGGGTASYDKVPLPMRFSGNVYLKGASPFRLDEKARVMPDFDPGMKLEEKGGEWWLEIRLDPAWMEEKREMVESTRLGRAAIPDLPFETPEGDSFRIDSDYFGVRRSGDHPAPGPIGDWEEEVVRLKVWPR